MCRFSSLAVDRFSAIRSGTHEWTTGNSDRLMAWTRESHVHSMQISQNKNALLDSSQYAHVPLWPLKNETLEQRIETRGQEKENKIFIALFFFKEEGKRREGLEERREEGRRPQRERLQGERELIYNVFMSLRAWSSSSLVALYFSFWLYSSSAHHWAEAAGGRRSGTGQQGNPKGERGKIKRRWKIRIDEQSLNGDGVAQEQVLQREFKPDVPSRSSMVFSSLATDLSANSARVSAFKRRKEAKEQDPRD